MKKLEEIKLVTKENWESLLRFRDKRLTGFGTGLAGLDAALRGLSGIVGIQGAPGACKSTLGLQIASYNARRGTPVLVIDRENGLSRLSLRLMCQIQKISQRDVLQCAEGTLRSYMGDIAEFPFYVETAAEVDVTLIRTYVSNILDTYQQPMLLLIDSLQAMPRIDSDERISLQKWMSELDQLKLDCNGNLVIIVTVEKRKGTYDESSNSAGKGTNSIEYKSEILLDLVATQGSQNIALTVVKHRDGAAGSKIHLTKRLASNDLNSFTFLLEEGQVHGL